MARLLTLNIDLYGYLTLTAQTDEGLVSKMSAFRIGVYGPVSGRMTPERERSLEVQDAAISCWNAELEARYSPELRAKPIYEIPIRAGRTA